MSNCLVSERRTSEAAKSKSSAELEARNDGGRSASEGMLSGRRVGSVGAIFAYIEMRSSVYEKVNVWPIRWGKSTHDVLGLLEDTVQIVLRLPHAWNTMFVIPEELFERGA
jgi:hypothetical protein